MDIFTKANEPVVSIIMTSYNYEEYIESAINSIIDQTYKNWVLIIIDDASIDNSVKIIQNFKEQYPDKIKLVLNENNLGIKRVNEIAFQYVTGDFVAFLESDDLWHTKYLEEKVNAMKKFPDVSLVYSNLELMGDNLNENIRYIDYLNYCRYVGKSIKYEPMDMYEIVLFRNPIVSFSNIFIRRELLSGIILNEEYAIWSDWQLVMQAALQGKFFYIDRILVKWRVHQESTNNKFIKKVNQKSEAGRFRVVLLSIIKEKVSRDAADKNIRYLIEPYSLQFKLKQLWHELMFVFDSPVTVFREIIRRIKNKD